MGFLGALFSGILGSVGQNGAANAQLEAQDQANKLRVTADALRTASQEKARADEKSIATTQEQALSQQAALGNLVENFRQGLLSGPKPRRRF